MTSLFLGHLLLFSGTLFVLLVIAVESGFRLAVRSGAPGSRPPRTSRRFRDAAFCPASLSRARLGQQELTTLNPIR